MAKKKIERQQIAKTDWKSTFTLVGTPKISDFTFKMNEVSSKNSSYTYHRMRLGVDCGSSGIVYCDMNGGYDTSNPYPIRLASKDDPTKQVEINWEDRFDEDALDSVADYAKIQVALKLNKNGKPVYEYFLHEYDAIAYIQQYLTDKTIVRVGGQLKWSMYNDKVSVTKKVNRISLVVTENPKCEATFSQSVLLDKNSIDTKSIDYEKNAAFLSTRILEYTRFLGDVEIAGQYPYPYTFELRAKTSQLLDGILSHYCKVKKNITQINFNGKIFEGGATDKPTIDNLSDDLKWEISVGLTTVEEALGSYAAVTRSVGNNETRLILTMPMMISDENNKGARAVYPDRYTEDDLSFDWLNQDDENEVQESTAVASDNVDEEDLSWLNLND